MSRPGRSSPGTPDVLQPPQTISGWPTRSCASPRTTRATDAGRPSISTGSSTETSHRRSPRRLGGWSTSVACGLLRRIGGRRVHAPEDPREPVDAVLDLVAGVIFGAGIDRNIIRSVNRGTQRRCRRCTSGVDSSPWLPVDGHHDGAIHTVFRPHPDSGVGAAGLLLNGVDVGDDTVVEALVVGCVRRTLSESFDVRQSAPSPATIHPVVSKGSRR
jgi:hypothetical protein